MTGSCSTRTASWTRRTRRASSSRSSASREAVAAGAGLATERVADLILDRTRGWANEVADDDLTVVLVDCLLSASAAAAIAAGTVSSKDDPRSCRHDAPGRVGSVSNNRLPAWRRCPSRKAARPSPSSGSTCSVSGPKSSCWGRSARRRRPRCPARPPAVAAINGGFFDDDRRSLRPAHRGRQDRGPAAARGSTGACSWSGPDAPRLSTRASSSRTRASRARSRSGRGWWWPGSPCASSPSPRAPQRGRARSRRAHAHARRQPGADRRRAPGGAAGRTRASIPRCYSTRRGLDPGLGRGRDRFTLDAAGVYGVPDALRDAPALEPTPRPA